MSRYRVVEQFEKRGFDLEQLVMGGTWLVIDRFDHLSTAIEFAERLRKKAEYAKNPVVRWQSPYLMSHLDGDINGDR